MAHELGKTLRTLNEPLSDQDRDTIRASLLEAKNSLDDLDRRLMSDPSLSQHFSMRRDQLLEDIERYRITLAPHKSLPAELWNYIFLVALDRYISLPLRRRHSSLVPWNISYVCSGWRRIILDEPRLWADIAVDYSSSMDHSKLNWVCNTIVLRSKGVGLSLSCTEDAPNVEDHASDASATQRELIITYAPRLVHLTVETTKDALVPYLESPPLQFTSLKSITLSVRGRYDPNDTLTDRVMTLFNDTPSLRKITLNAFLQYRLPSDLLLVPWIQITDLVLRQVVMPNETALALLRHCTSLRVCQLTISDTMDPVVMSSSDDVPTIIVHNLHSLTLQIEVKVLAIHFLNSLSLPSLQALDIGPNPRGGIIPQRLPQDAIVSILKRSRCNLDTFTCRYRDDFDTHKLLVEMPNLRSFSLTARYLEDSVIGAMSRGELVPRLEHIHCGLKTIHPFLDFMEGSWIKSSLATPDGYKGLVSVNVWGYTLPDREGAQTRIDMLQPWIELEDRTVSIFLGDG